MAKKISGPASRQKAKAVTDVIAMLDEECFAGSLVFGYEIRDLYKLT